MLVEIKLNSIEKEIGFSSCQSTEIRLMVHGRNVSFFMQEITNNDRDDYEEKLSTLQGKDTDLKILEEFKIDHTLNFVLGFQSNFFAVDQKPFNSKPSIDGYDKHWKQTLKEYAPGLLLEICKAYFDESNYLLRKNLPEEISKRANVQENNPGKKKNFVERIFKTKN